MSRADRTRARRRLLSAATALRFKGPKHAGRVARIEAVLLLDGWPFDLKIYEAFCKEMGIPA